MTGCRRILCGLVALAGLACGAAAEDAGPVLHFNQGSYDLALADMNDVIARDAPNPAHYENRAAIYQATEHRELCQRDLAIAAQLAGSALA